MTSPVSPILVAAIVLCAVTASGLVIHRFAGLSLAKPSIPGLFFYFFVLMSAGPAVLVYANHAPDPAAGLFITGVEMVLPFVSLGVAFGGLALRVTRETAHRMYSTVVLEPGPSQRSVMAALFVACLAITALYFLQAPSIPLLYAIRNPGQAAAFTGLREQSFKLLDSRLYFVYFVLRQTVWPFLVSYFLLCFLVHRTPLRFGLFAAAFFVAIFYAAASLARGPAAVIFLIASLSWLLWRRGRVSVLFAATAGSAILAIPILILALFSPDRSLASMLGGIVHRLLYVPAENAYFYFYSFGATHPFLLGRSIDRLAAVVRLVHPTFSTFDAPNYVFRMANPSTALSTGAASAPFFADAYANFGILGVPVVAILAGLIMQLAQAWAASLRRDPLGVVVQAGLLYTFWELNRTTLTSVVFSYGGLGIVLLYFGVMVAQDAVRVTWSRSRGPQWT